MEGREETRKQEKKAEKKENRNGTHSSGSVTTSRDEDVECRVQAVQRSNVSAVRLTTNRGTYSMQ